jgi:hypothetical protein
VVISVPHAQNVKALGTEDRGARAAYVRRDRGHPVGRGGQVGDRAQAGASSRPTPATLRRPGKPTSSQASAPGMFMILWARVFIRHQHQPAGAAHKSRISCLLSCSGPA